MKYSSLGSTVLAGLLATTAQAGTVVSGDESWPELNLGDLMKVGVESASRKNQSISNTAAAAFVISAADIRRSGVLSIPDALRLAPGVEVARISNNRFAVSIRGFNGRMANKLLVLVDGRSIYSTLYGGVVWDAENIPMEEISRIEVIRGSAGLAWGSNAVNGVINIITKRAQDTSGWMTDTHVGNSTGKAGATLRYGAKLEDGSALRVTLNEQRRDGGKEVNGKDAQDQWNDSSLSFRYDNPVGLDTRWLFSGRYFDSQSGEPWLMPTFNNAAAYDPANYGSARLEPFVSKKNGGDLLGRFEQTTDSGGEVRVQAYVEAFHGEIPAGHDDHNTVDLDAQHRFAPGGTHDIVWGANYRQSRHREHVPPNGFLTTSSPEVKVALASLFVQDELTVIPRTFNVQAGVRIEKQTFGGTAPQPSIRALWTPSAVHSLWLAWSKTTRSPSVTDRVYGAYPAVVSATGPGTLPVLVHVTSGEQTNFGNEKVRTIEAGHRAQWTPTFYSDLTAYVSKYEGVFGRTSQSAMAANSAAGFTGLPVDPVCSAALVNAGLNPAAPGLCITYARGNALPVRTRGLELSTEWDPSPDWRLQINASRLWLDGGSGDNVVYGNSPNYQGAIRSSHNLTPDRHFDLWLRRIGGLSNPGYFSNRPGTPPIAARNELDLRLAEQVNASLELSLTLQNLLSKNQLQFYPDYMPTLPVVPQRTIYLKALWRDK